MTGCEACSALVNAGDEWCAICGADLKRPSARKAAGAAPRPKVDIPVRRYGRAPPPHSMRSRARRQTTPRSTIVAAALLAAGLAGGLAAWLQFG